MKGPVADLHWEVSFGAGSTLTLSIDNFWLTLTVDYKNNMLIINIATKSNQIKSIKQIN